MRIVRVLMLVLYQGIFAFSYRIGLVQENAVPQLPGPKLSCQELCANGEGPFCPQDCSRRGPAGNKEAGKQAPESAKEDFSTGVLVGQGGGA